MQDHEDQEDSGSKHLEARDAGALHGPIDVRPARAPQLRTPRAAGVAGIIFSLLMAASFVLVRFPTSSLTEAEMVAWFQEQGSSALTLVGLYLVPFMGIAFLWFIAVIRQRIGRFEDQFFSTVFLGSGLLFIAMIFTGLAVAGSLVIGQRFLGATALPDADWIQSTRALAATFVYVYGAKMAGVFVLVTNTIAFRTRVFSRWVALVGYLAGFVLLLHIGFYFPLVVVFPTWVMFLSIYLVITAPRLDEEMEEETSTPGD